MCALIGNPVRVHEAVAGAYSGLVLGVFYLLQPIVQHPDELAEGGVVQCLLR